MDLDLGFINPLDQTHLFSKAEDSDGDSDDSDEETGMGNVAKLVLRPAGHTGKAKRGHLCFDASFESGNLGRVDHVNEFEYDLFIRPDSCNPRFRFWFNFSVDNVRTDQRVIFNIVNFGKGQTLCRDGLTPLVKSTSRPEWVRVLSSQVFYRRSPEHGNKFVLSIAFAFDREEDVYQFALSFPYSYSRYEKYLSLLDGFKFAYYKKELITPTLHKRDLNLLTITNPKNLEPGVQQKTIAIIARIHPGESPTSFVAQGLIDFLLSDHPLAIDLREYLVFKIFPMANPDGVFLGNYRCSLIGSDLNRKWHCISEWAHPEIHAIKLTLAELDRGKNSTLEFVIDLHSHPGLYGTFVYGNSYDDFLRLERHLLFPKLLSQNAPDYVPSNCCFNRDGAKIGTARRYLSGFLKENVNVYTLQCSIYGYPEDVDGVNIIPYTEESYNLLGRNLAKTFYDYYRLTGHIPPPPKPRPVRPKGWLKPRMLSRNRKNKPEAGNISGTDDEKSGSPSDSEFVDEFINYQAEPTYNGDRLSVHLTTSHRIQSDRPNGGFCNIYTIDSDEPVMLKKAPVSPASSPSFRYNRKSYKPDWERLDDLVIDVKAARRKKKVSKSVPGFPPQKPQTTSTAGRRLLTAPIEWSSSDVGETSREGSRSQSPAAHSPVLSKTLNVVDFSSLIRTEKAKPLSFQRRPRK